MFAVDFVINGRFRHNFSMRLQKIFTVEFYIQNIAKQMSV